jgi:hypothetical protein
LVEPATAWQYDSVAPPDPLACPEIPIPDTAPLPETEAEIEKSRSMLM